MIRAIDSISKPLFNRFIKRPSVKLPEVSKPIIAAYYRTAEEKLNDIYMDRLASHQSTTTVEHNIKVFNDLPEKIKKCIQPEDIDYTGHIDQTWFKSIWESAKKARTYGVYGVAPTFKGADDIALEGINNVSAFALTTPNLGSEALRDSLPAINFDIVNAGDLSEGLAHSEALSEGLSHLETLRDGIEAADAIDASGTGLDIINDIIDALG